MFFTETQGKATIADGIRDSKKNSYIERYYSEVFTYMDHTLFY